MGEAEQMMYLEALLEVRDYAHEQAEKVSNGFVAREKWHRLEVKIRKVTDGERYVPEAQVWEAFAQPLTDKEWLT